MIRDLAGANLSCFSWVDLTPEEILALFDVCGAAWVHDGNPENPHAELTSGLCSNGYFDCPRVLCYPSVAESFARLVVRLLRQNYVPRPDWVIGSAYAAITFSYEVAKILGAKHGFVEKDPEDPKGKRMLWKRMAIPKGSRILQIEELITTSQTFQEVRRAVTEGNPEPVEFLPFVGSLVHRPSRLQTIYEGVSVIALVEKKIWVFEPQNCPLCAQGSVRYRPKSHWTELTGKR